MLRHPSIISILLVVSMGCTSLPPKQAALPKANELAQRLSEQALNLSGYEGYSRTVNTDSAEAQHWVNQGLQLVYGFSHDAGVWAFGKAAEEDPSCVMAWWGIAYGYGIDVNNADVSEQEAADAAAAATQAVIQSLCASSINSVEQALAHAIAKRAVFPIPEDRKPLDESYADAMEEAWKRFPNDPDVGTLFAESLMNLQAWDYWTTEGEPIGRTREIVSVLEKVLDAHPNHPGANHFYIHAMEASSSPESALPSARKLESLVPGSGHLVHMPSHIFVNVGRYAEAVTANEKAIAADEAYFSVVGKPTFYRLYFLHNMHFLAYAAMMEGRSALALSAFSRMESETPEETLRMLAPIADGISNGRLHALVRFGKWEEILKQPEYQDFRLASRAMRAYARTIALANLGRLAAAREELVRFKNLAVAIPDNWKIGSNPAADIMELAKNVAEGEVLWREGKTNQGLQKLREAVAQEDTMIYAEPPGWLFPVRHALGALLVVNGNLEEAEDVYRTDLEHHPENAWSLLGLEKALRGQGKIAEADALAPRTTAAWARADVDAPASCYCAVSL